MTQDHKAAFREEAQELLADLETTLLELEDEPANMENIGRAFRALHTIKGAGAMFGFDDIAAFTHQLEATFDLVREGRIPVTKDLVRLTLASGDHIRCLLEGPEGGPAFDPAKGQELLASLSDLVAGHSGNPPSPDSRVPPDTSDHSLAASDQQSPELTGEGLVTYRIRFRPDSNILLTGTNPFFLLDELHGLGACTVTAQVNHIPPLHELDPETCVTFWDIILTSALGTDAIKDVFIFVEDECELSIEIIARDDDASDVADPEELMKYKKLGEILVERGDLKPNAVESALRLQKPIGQLLVETGAVDQGLVESALVEQQHVKKLTRERSDSTSSSTIRVPAEKLDTLVDLVGELVTVQARLSQTSALRNDPDFLSIAEEVERLTVELRDNTMNIRMVPIGSTFSKFKRLVHDLSAELGKEVVMVTEGAETELDKTVIEHLNEPLVHLIRNSIDHGIELPEARTAAGKDIQGLVHLSAVHSGSHVLIEIKDDGAGLDPEAIRAKAIAKGIISPEAELTEKEIFALIFTPGFSTAAQVTNISGRGVGMDVVKRRIDALRGSIEVNSRKGIGTTITLKLPLTLAIIEGLLVKIAEAHFVLPLSIVEECVELSAEQRAKANGRHFIGLRDEIVPYVRLRERFAIDGDIPPIEQIVVTESTGGRMGFVVDSVVGEHQTVIKNLNRVYRDVEEISGATILGDGTVALVIDAAKLVQNIESEEQSELHIHTDKRLN
ncbi:MAG: chemotaxis protein CheA [Syntrophobacter sp.]